MTAYRRDKTAGASYFFTVNVLDRKSGLLTKHIDVLREAYRYVMKRHPYFIVLFVKIFYLWIGVVAWMKGILVNNILARWLMLCDGFRASTYPTISKLENNRPLWDYKYKEAELAKQGYSGDALNQKMIDDALDVEQLKLKAKHVQCFPAGTLVHTEKGLIPIQDIIVGDMVLSRPEWGGKDAPTEYKRVTRAFCSGDDELIRLSCQLDGEYDDLDAPIYIEFMTPNHPVWVESLKEWVPASDLQIGSLLSSIDNKNNLRVLSIERVLKGVVNEEVVIGGCMNPSFGNGDGSELDMLIQFDKDKYLLDFNQYNTCYSITQAELVKLDSDLIEQVADQCYGYGKNTNLKVSVYNLEVENYHTYFIGIHGVWVHNANCFYEYLPNLKRDNSPSPAEIRNRRMGRGTKPIFT